MKIQITLQIDLGDSFIDEEEKDWLFNHLLAENLFLHDNKIGEKIGNIEKIIEIKEMQ